MLNYDDETFQAASDTLALLSATTNVSTFQPHPALMENKQSEEVKYDFKFLVLQVTLLLRKMWTFSIPSSICKFLRRHWRRSGVFVVNFEQIRAMSWYNIKTLVQIFFSFMPPEMLWDGSFLKLFEIWDLWNGGLFRPQICVLKKLDLVFL